MKVDYEEKLDFGDVLLKPKRSFLTSKNDVTLERTFKFQHSPREWTGIPIMASNMDGVGTFSMAKVLQTYKILTIIKKGYDWRDWGRNIGEGVDPDYVGISVGTGVWFDRGAADFVTLKKVLEIIPQIGWIVVDVANGYLESSVGALRIIREEFPNHIIVCGNVATIEMAEELIFEGADIIKVGIGPGCLKAGSRILMSNGFYKNIEDVKPNDRVITMDGSAATVKRSFCTGVREVKTIKTTQFHSGLSLTPDHKCFVGNLDTVSKSTLSSKGYKRVLNQPTKFGESKKKWTEAAEFNRTVPLLPLNIEFELAENFLVDLDDYFIRPADERYNKRVSSNYNSGYVFGFFLGDGTSHLTENKTDRGISRSGSVCWSIHKNDHSYIEKLMKCVEETVGKPAVIKPQGEYVNVILYSKQWAEFFSTFGKRAEKHLPEYLLCSSREFLKGLFDGLLDSDGTEHKGRISFKNTSLKLIELFSVVHYIIEGYFPEISDGRLENSKLVTAVNEAYNARSYIYPERRMDDEHLITKITDNDDSTHETEVFDLEIDHPSHSFIANNIIVHNSVCTTRIKSGVGVPQLSAIMDCSDVHGVGGHIIGDGGCTSPGDVAKAFGAGADFVMLGSMLAAHTECEEQITINDTGSYVTFYGMSSEAARQRHGGRKDGYRSMEGRVVNLPYRGDVNKTIEDILGGLTSSMVYIGANKIKDMPKCATFSRVRHTHSQWLREFDTDRQYD